MSPRGSSAAPQPGQTAGSPRNASPQLSQIPSVKSFPFRVCCSSALKSSQVQASRVQDTVLNYSTRSCPPTLLMVLGSLCQVRTNNWTASNVQEKENGREVNAKIAAWVRKRRRALWARWKSAA